MCLAGVCILGNDASKRGPVLSEMRSSLLAEVWIISKVSDITCRTSLFVFPLTKLAFVLFRTAECLSLLSKIDLLVQKVEDGLVKVEAMKHILEVDSSKKEEPTVEVSSSVLGWRVLDVGVGRL